MRQLIVLGVLLYSVPVLAQGAAHTVSPGMTKTQVISSLGQPVTARTVGEDTYLFYANTCGKRCGMNDLVILHADGVSDAIFRSPDRHYTGKSSSPAAISGRTASREKPTPSEPMKVRPDSSKMAPKRMKPIPANDTRPSIPVNPPMLRPAPGTKPAASATKPASATTKPASKTP
ncbi:MAG: outer membrane protein assembly factor BamE [Gemmatimonadota bacterium]|nr:outer membrane protein assembly factor BamE [Gemmatimonadota bacterium]